MIELLETRLGEFPPTFGRHHRFCVSHVMNAIKWVFKRAAPIALFGLGAAAFLLVCLWIEHYFAVELPRPTGSFAVGRTTRSWAGRLDADLSAGDSKSARQIFAWIWYPAAIAQPPASTEAYLPAPWREAIEASGSAFMRHLFERDLSRVIVHSLHEPAASPARASYPVVVFRGGGATQAAEYSALAEDLASHGYIVVGIDAPYRTRVFVMPDGIVIERSNENNPELVPPQQAFEHMLPRLVNEWSADVAFTLDRLADLDSSDQANVLSGKLDLTRVSVVGHSLGGAVAAEFCANDARCKVGIDIDGLVTESVAQHAPVIPFMFLMSDHSRDYDPLAHQITARLDSAFHQLPPQSRAWLEIRGANHYNFSDGAVVKSHIAMSILHLIGVVGMDGRRQLAITAYCMQTFLDAHLAAAPPVAPTAPDSLYPEIQIRR
jgi:pimeloyl-ACP methyl ester carboxylesterase